jgi:CDP-diacylglycerol--glycerol-3-phosphate 3-phosphatidyltransferase
MKKMNIANKLTFARVILAFLILLLIGLPWHNFGVEWPSYVLVGRITLRLNYLIGGVLFILASLTDMLDGKAARKLGLVSDFGKVFDAIADKILVNGLLIVLAYNRDIALIVPVVIITRDIIVDAIKMLSGNKGKVVAASMAGKVKTACMMSGLCLLFFGGLPFSLLGIAVDQGLILFATCMSVYSGIQYFLVNKDVAFGDMNK